MTTTRANYVCPTCGATKEIVDRHGRANGLFPPTVPCGWRGCDDLARFPRRFAMRVAATSGPVPANAPRAGFYLGAVGRFLAGIDLDAEPLGRFEWTDDPAEALVFPDAGAVLVFWKQQSRRWPRRPHDGKPNRPLTAWTVESIDLDQPIPAPLFGLAPRGVG